MFDIKEYFIDHPDYHDNFSLHLETEIIENDISADIDNLLKNRFDSLYLRDKLKNGSSGIEIIYPRVSYPGKKAFLKTSDHIRFLLSLYPLKSDYENVDKIVLRPRHIEIGNIELMSLYMRNRKILVLYLYSPHFYSIEDSKFRHYSELTAYHLPELVNKTIAKDNSNRSQKTSLKVPPIWYILSIVSHSQENKMDKFFIKKGKEYPQKVSEVLDEISFYYSRHGY